MKEVIALIRPGKAKMTKQKLAEDGFIPYTEQSVLGRGKQLGLQYGQTDGGQAWPPSGIPFLPKRMLTIFVQDEEIDRVVAIVRDTNKTGDIGDGKIFICPVDDAVRVRTDERGRRALSVSEEEYRDAGV